MHIGIDERSLTGQGLLAQLSVMTDNIGTLSLQYSLQFTVPYVQMIKTCPGINGFASTVNQVINDKDIMSCIQISTCQVRTNKTCTTNNSYFHKLFFLPSQIDSTSFVE